jgi:hypothetical protein
MPTGLVIGDGFYPHNVDALLTVIAEDSRSAISRRVHRGRPMGPMRRLPHLIANEPGCLVSRILPLVGCTRSEHGCAHFRRLREGRRHRSLTGLMNEPAFMAELRSVMRDASRRSGGCRWRALIFDGDIDLRAG